MNSIDFNFLIDQDVCAYCLVFRYITKNENADFFADKHQQALNLYNKYKQFNFEISQIKNNELLQEIKQSEVFNQALQTSYKYLNCIKEEWQKYKPIAQNYLAKTLNHNKQHLPVDVYVTNASAYSTKNFIVFGLSQTTYVKGFSFAYLFHEWLHQLENQIFKNTFRLTSEIDFCHAVVELCAERNISKTFGFSEIYFPSHKGLEQHRQCIYPYFKQMLLSGDFTLEDFFVWTSNNALKLKQEMKNNNIEK